jgi:hypothetical protein
MKKALGLFALAASVWLGHGHALAADAAPAPVPDLVGTWAGPYKAMRAKGIAQGTLELRVLSQDGALFKAEKTWETPGLPGHIGDKEIEKATEPLVGVVDFDGTTVHLAEQGDNGLYSGRLSAPNTLDLIYVEAGHGTAYRVRLTRTK